MSELVEPAENHVRCNGALKDTEKQAGDVAENLPNGIHILNTEKILQKDVEKLKNNGKPGEVLKKEKTAQDHAVKSEDSQSNQSTNELIDKFSTELTLSLINSSLASEVGEKSNGDNSGNASELTDVTKSVKYLSDKPGGAAFSVDSTVVFPISQTPTNSQHLVGEKDGIQYLRYENETQMSAIMQLITKDLSEPYSIYTYRYFIHNWPHLCFLAMHGDDYVGAIVCKLDLHKKISRRGYIAMLAVDKSVRRRNIGTNLVKMAIETMHKEGCDEVVLETEVTNKPALRLYENLGFVRDKRLFRYYLNGVDALRLKLWLR